MKLFLLPLLFVAPVLAQLPAQSTSNGITLYITEVQIDVPSGPSQTVSIATACTNRTDAVNLTVDLHYGEGSTGSARVDLQRGAPTKSDLGTCVSTIVPSPRKGITDAYVTETRTVPFLPAPPDPAK